MISPRRAQRRSTVRKTADSSRKSWTWRSLVDKPLSLQNRSKMKLEVIMKTIPKNKRRI